MASFRRSFRPTKEELIENSLYFYHLILKSKEEKSCNSCINRALYETYNVGGVKDVLLECKLNELEETVLKENCKNYEFDRTIVDEIITDIKDLFKEKEE